MFHRPLCRLTPSGAATSRPQRLCTEPRFKTEAPFSSQGRHNFSSTLSLALLLLYLCCPHHCLKLSLARVLFTVLADLTAPPLLRGTHCGGSEKHGLWGSCCPQMQRQCYCDLAAKSRVQWFPVLIPFAKHHVKSYNVPGNAGICSKSMSSSFI